MRSAAERTLPWFSSAVTDLLDHVDYRLAETPEDKEEIYRLRYRAYLREGAIRPSAESNGSPISYDDAPNAWTFGVYFHGELYSSIRISVLTSEWRDVASSEMFGDLIHPELDRGKIIIDPTRFVADPEQGQAISRTALCDGAARLRWPAGISAPISASPIVRPEHQAFYRRVFLQEPWCEPRLYPGTDQAGRADGRRIFRRCGTRCSQRYPVYAFERLRAADAVRARAAMRFVAASDVRRRGHSIVPQS